MSTKEISNRPRGVGATPDVRTAGKTFVLWREVAMAYASPAITAGIGGLVTANRDLQIEALTTIGGASAVVALLIGLWLQHYGARMRWLVHTNHFVVVSIFALFGVVIGFFAAWLTTLSLERLLPSAQAAWFSRVWIDFPLSAAIASTLIAWRWRLARK